MMNMKLQHNKSSIIKICCSLYLFICNIVLYFENTYCSYNRAVFILPCAIVEKEIRSFLFSNHYSKTFSSTDRVMKRCLIRLPTIKGNKIVLRLEGVRGSDTTT